MLLYLINVVDDAWLLAIGGPLAILAARRLPDRRQARRLMAGAFGLGLAAAVVYAALRRNTGWVIREFYDLGVLVPAIASAASLMVLAALPKDPGPRLMVLARAAAAFALSGLFLGVFWHFRGRPTIWTAALAFAAAMALVSAGPLKVKSTAWPLALSAALALASLAARAAPSLILYPLDFDVGLDSVFNMEYLGKLGGYLAGLAIMAMLWLSIAFLCRQAPGRAVRVFAALSTLLILAQLGLEAGQILAARRLVPRPVFRAVLWALEREGAFFWLQAALWGALALGLMAKARLSAPAGANPALRRKAKAALRRDFRAGAALAMAMIMVLVTANTLRAVSRRGPVIAEPDPVEALDGRISLPLETISDGGLHRLVYQSASGTPVRLIVIKKSQSAYGVGLDACDICGQSGYYQRGDQVVCKLCDVVMNKSTIGFPGGCNPVPLDFELAEGAMIIRAEDLDAEAHRFE